MRFIIVGIALDLIAVAAIAVLIFLPMFMPDNATLTNLLDSLLCETGEAYEARPIVTEDSEGTGYSLYAVCAGERGERDVTPQQTIYGIVAFLVPFLPGLGLSVLGAMQMKARRERPRDVTHLFTGTRTENPVSWSHQPMQSGGSQMRTLTEKLTEIDEAYEKRLITREEMEIARRKAIDEST